MFNHEALEILAKTIHECQPELPIIDYARVITEIQGRIRYKRIPNAIEVIKKTTFYGRLLFFIFSLIPLLSFLRFFL